MNSLCVNLFLQRRRGQRYCSLACANQGRWATKWVELTNEQREILEEMLSEVQSQCLEVVLVPSRVEDRGKIRAVAEENARWYREFCELFPSRARRSDRKREFDTAIRRRETIKALERLLEGNATSPYAQRLLNFIDRKLSQRSEQSYGPQFYHSSEDREPSASAELT